MKIYCNKENFIELEQFLFEQKFTNKPNSDIITIIVDSDIYQYEFISLGNEWYITTM